MLKKILLTLIVLTLPIAARANDIWQEYSTHLTYNYLIKTNLQTNNRLTNKESVDLITKSFSQSLGLRLTSVAHEKRFIGIVCIFSREPEKCVFDNISKPVFEEIGFIKMPEISQKNLKKISKTLFSSQFFKNDTKNKLKESKSIPTNKINFKYGVDSNSLAPTIKFPFYTYNHIYVEPKINLKKVFTVTFIKDRWLLDIENGDVTLKYYIPQKLFLKNNLVISYSSKTIQLENSIIKW